MGVRIGLIGLLAIWLVSCGEANSIDATVEARLAAVEQDVDAMVQATVEALSVNTPTPTSDLSLGATTKGTAVTSFTYVPTATLGSTPSPTGTQAPTSTPQPTPTLIPTHTPRPTSTPLPPATATPVPTPTLIPTPTPVPTPSSVQELVRQSLPSIARIVTVDGSGTGFVYAVNNTKAYIVTNAHVVEGGSRVTVEVDDETYEGQVLGADGVRDVAVISICCGKFKPLRFSDEGVELGQEVLVIGHALALKGDPSVTRGIVSAKRYSTEHESNVIQTDAPINRGNSGGPMLALNGSVVGMSTWKLSGGTVESVGFAVVADAVRVKAAALANPDTVEYAGRQFVRVGGPVDVLIVDKDSFFSGFVQAQNFIAEIQVIDPDQQIAFYITSNDKQDPVSESFAIRSLRGCAHLRILQNSELSVKELIPPVGTGRLETGDYVRMIVIGDRVEIFVGDVRICQAEWGFERAGLVALVGDEGQRYKNHSIWTER